MSGNEEKSGSLLHDLTSTFRAAVLKAYPDLPPDFPCPVTGSAKSDYQFNGAMAINGLLKASGCKTNPREVAGRILEMIRVEESGLLERVEVAGPGFINIFIKKTFVEGVLTRILKKGQVEPPKIGDGRKKVSLLYSRHRLIRPPWASHFWSY